MLINVKKTTMTTMFASLNKLRFRPEEYNDYLFSNKFKLLGTWIDSNLSINSHVGHIKAKFSYVSYKLTGIRLKKDFRLNSNLFTTIIQPLFRMAGCIYHYLNKTNK